MFNDSTGPQLLFTVHVSGGVHTFTRLWRSSFKKNPRILEIVIERLSCPAECILNLNQTGEFSKLHHSPQQLRESKCPLCHRNLHPRGNGRVTLQREGNSRQRAVTSSTPSSSSSLSSPSSSCRHHSYKHIFQSSA